MRLEGETIAERRIRLAGDIARQRGELASAYRNLATPIHYTEQAMRGFGFLRQNPWVVSTIPAVVSIGSALWGLRKGAKAEKLTRTERSRLRELKRERPAKGILGHALKWGGHGWKVFKVYRKLRAFMP